MEMVKKLPPETKVTSTGSLKQNSMGLFHCPQCGQDVVKIRHVGRKAQTCGAVGCKPSGPQSGHKESGSPLYIAWSNMRQYCKRSKNQYVPEWDSFMRFSLDMGTTFVPGRKLTRKDSLQPYSKENCYWLKKEEVFGKPTNSIQQSVVTGRLFEQHGMHKTRPYRIWQNMRTRCYDPKHHRYAVYGGRGIKVCDEWLNSFTAFWQDMQEGYTDEMTIDRIDPNGDYCKQNCRWISLAENSSRSRALATQQIDPVTGVVIRTWASAREAGMALGIDPSSITKVIKSKIKSAGGFLWKLENN